jgi:enoyl-CoA hydratase/carnithine racemase
MTNRAENLLVTLADGIKRITINRPERRNSVDLETVAMVRDAIGQSLGAFAADSRGEALG